MATYVIGTNSVHTSAEVCGYLSRRIDAGNVAHAVNSHPGNDDIDSEDIRNGKDALNVAVSRLGDLVDIEAHQYIRDNDAAGDVLQCTDEHDADEIAIGVRKRNPTSKTVFGSMAQDMLLHSNIPMAVVPLETV